MCQLRALDLPAKAVEPIPFSRMLKGSGEYTKSQRSKLRNLTKKSTKYCAKPAIVSERIERNESRGKRRERQIEGEREQRMESRERS